MALKKTDFWLATFLVVYLLVIGVGATVLLIVNFPTQHENAIAFAQSDDGKSLLFFPFGKLRSVDQGLLLLALLAGMSGSFLHAAQSLSSYIGNTEFKISWGAWYFLRPWIGGILGFVIYFAFRAGLIAGAGSMNPYGVVAVGLMGGWFSKTTTDKLQEVFETLFKTDQDKKRLHKLSATAQPVVESIDPAPVPSGATEFFILGRDFQKGAVALLNEQEVQAEFISAKKLKVSIAQIAQRPASGTEASIKVKNPEGIEPLSASYNLKFE
ncbi:hypothetical protein HUU05_06565 [candidate division KSB1 bacterium]|nr:hypothetical protein [candidate division KSB1 bacterium]